MKRSLFMEDVLINKATEIEALVLGTLHNWLVYCVQHNENLGKDGKYLIRRSWSKLTKDLGLFTNKARMEKICYRLKDKGLIDLRPNNTCQGFSFPNQDWRLKLEGEALTIMHYSNISSKPTGFFYLKDENNDSALSNSFEGGRRISRGAEEFLPELSNELSNELVLHKDIAVSHEKPREYPKKEQADSIIALWQELGLKPIEKNIFIDSLASEILAFEINHKIPLEQLKDAIRNYADIKGDSSIVYDCNWSLRAFMGKLGPNHFEKFLPENFSKNNFVKKRESRYNLQQPEKISQSVIDEVVAEKKAKIEKIEQEAQRARDYEASYVKSDEEIEIERRHQAKLDAIDVKNAKELLQRINSGHKLFRQSF